MGADLHEVHPQGEQSQQGEAAQNAPLLPEKSPAGKHRPHSAQPHSQGQQIEKGEGEGGKAVGRAGQEEEGDHLFIGVNQQSG